MSLYIDKNTTLRKVHISWWPIITQNSWLPPDIQKSKW